MLINGIKSKKINTNKEKYTIVGVLEKINEAGKARAKLIDIGSTNVSLFLKEEGDDWLDDVDTFGVNAKRIREEVIQAASKDKELK